MSSKKTHITLQDPDLLALSRLVGALSAELSLADYFSGEIKRARGAKFPSLH